MPDRSSFCLYALQSTLPTTRQRKGHPADWMETDSRAICPDPACALVMRMYRTATRMLNHDEVSAVPLPEDKAG